MSVLYSFQSGVQTLFASSCTFWCYPPAATDGAHLGLWPVHMESQTPGDERTVCPCNCSFLGRGAKPYVRWARREVRNWGSRSNVTIATKRLQPRAPSRRQPDCTARGPGVTSLHACGWPSVVGGFKSRMQCKGCGSGMPFKRDHVYQWAPAPGCCGTSVVFGLSADRQCFLLYTGQVS